MLATRRGPLVLIVLHCYFVSTFCEDRINTFLILILILTQIESSRYAMFGGQIVSRLTSFVRFGSNS